MKSLILVVAFFFSICSVAQVNPWTPKGENPWVVYQGAGEVVVAEEVAEEILIDTAVLNEEAKTALQTQSIDTSYNYWTTQQVTSHPDTTKSESELLYIAGRDGVSTYNAAGDFAFGFAMGMIVNLLSVPLIDPIYAIPTSKKEKAAIKEVVNNPVYGNVNKDKLNKKVKSTIKGKKLGMTILGSITGSLVQFGILFALAN